MNSSLAAADPEITFVKPSLCIPRTFKNISKKRVFAVFKKLNLGWIGRIDVVPKTASDGTEFVCVFIHFSRWFDTADTCAFLEKLENSDIAISVVYQEPWFWKIKKCISPIPTPTPTPTPTPNVIVTPNMHHPHPLVYSVPSTPTPRIRAKPRLYYSSSPCSPPPLVSSVSVSPIFKSPIFRRKSL